MAVDVIPYSDPRIYPSTWSSTCLGFSRKFLGRAQIWVFEVGFLRVLLTMDNLPAEICHKIFCLLDHQHLAAAQQVCRNWSNIASQDELWRNLFIQRWGIDQANFFSPLHPKTWKMTYETQDRCDRVGLGLTVTCEGYDYYIVYQGEIQHWLGSKKTETVKEGITDMKTTDGNFSSPNDGSTIERENAEILPAEKGPCPGLFDKILFFVGDLEKASRQVKRKRIL